MKKTPFAGGHNAIASRRGAVISVLCAALLAAAAPSRPKQTMDLHESISAVLQTPVVAAPILRQELTRFYRLGDGRPKWIAPSGQPTHSARQALRILAAAAEDGLSAADYDVQRLTGFVDGWPASGSSTRAGAEFDVGLSAAMIRFARDLHVGRANPREAEFPFVAYDTGTDIVDRLQNALDHNAVDQLVRELRPPLAQYEALRGQLGQYHVLRFVRLEPDALAAEPQRAPAHPTQALIEHLRATGDFSSHERVAAELADPAVFRSALERFQRRHGLKPDGIIGPATRAALLVPLAARMRQIELSLERLRWLPRVHDRQVLVINIPMFRLWGWKNWKTDAPSVAMDVIVGRARRTPTPAFLVGELREVVFRPFWNVPRSIVVKEVLPLAKRNPTYLARENMETVRGDGDDADVVETSAANLAGLRAGTLRLRQRPGPRNALGLAKFVFPNVQNVYLHDTPGRSLFTQARRDFSHGCVRVEDPVGLAVWVLDGDWGREQVLAVMHGTNNRHVPVLKPQTVVVFYATAFVMPEDGLLHFADDIYGQDALLDRALTSLSGS